jgi:hypothetical protein
MNTELTKVEPTMTRLDIPGEQYMVKHPKRVVNKNYREAILAIEKKVDDLGSLGEDCFPLEHSFAEGMYVRKVFMPKGYIVVSKLHKDSYLSCVLSGDLSMITEEGYRRVVGPCSFISPPGTKRILWIHEDTEWLTAHPNPKNITELEDLKKMVYVKDFSEVPGDIIEMEETCDEIDYFMKALNDLETKGVLCQE